MYGDDNKAWERFRDERGSSFNADDIKRKMDGAVRDAFCEGYRQGQLEVYSLAERLKQAAEIVKPNEDKTKLF